MLQILHLHNSVTLVVEFWRQKSTGSRFLLICSENCFCFFIWLLLTFKRVVTKWLNLTCKVNFQCQKSFYSNWLDIKEFSKGCVFLSCVFCAACQNLFERNTKPLENSLLGVILEKNKWLISRYVVPNIFFKWKTKSEKSQMIFDIESWLWKVNLSTFWQPFRKSEKHT